MHDLSVSHHIDWIINDIKMSKTTIFFSRPLFSYEPFSTLKHNLIHNINIYI